MKLSKWQNNFVLFLALGLLSAVMAGTGLAADRENTAVQEADRNNARYQSQAAIMAQGNVDLLMIGDSITHGWEGSGKQVWQKYYGNRKAMNFGISGDRTQHVLWRLANSPLDKISPKMAVVMIGTNNIGSADRNTPEETVEGIKKIVAVLKEKFPKMKILLLEVFPRDAAAKDVRRIKVDTINKGLRDAFKNVENVELMGIGHLFLDKDGNLPKDIMPDFLHPNHKGYEIWASAIEPKIAKVIGSLPTPENSVAVVPANKLNENWWKARFESQAKRIAEGNVDLLMIGDSITHFWENRGKDVWNEFYGKRNVANFGISADRTEHVIWRLLNSPLDKISPKMSVIMIGTNNVGHRTTTPEETVWGIQKIVSILKEKYPKMKILLLEVFPRGANANDYYRQKVNAINAGLRTAFAKVDNVQLYGIGDLFLEGKDQTLPKSLMPDLLHPNADGYKIWARAMEPMIVETLGEKMMETEPVGRPNMANNWWMKRFEEKNARMKEGKVDLVFVGDSITHRWEKERKRDAVPGIYKDNGAEVWEKYYGTRNAVNLGIDGDQTQHVIWRLQNYDWSKAKPKMAVVLIGVNNTSSPANKPANIAMGVRTVVKTLKAKSPGIKVLVMKIFPCQIVDKKNGPRQQYVDPVNELLPYYLRDLDEVTLIDISKVFRNDKGEITLDIMPDKIHLSKEGYDREAKALEPYIASLFGKVTSQKTKSAVVTVAVKEPVECIGVPVKSNWWQSRFNQKNELLKKGNIDILMIGDSITHGWEGSGKAVWDKYYGDKKAINLGIGGDRTQHVIWRLENYDFSNVNPKLAVLLIGVNNWGSSKAENIAAGNRKICQILHQKFPKMKVIVLNVFPFGDKNAVEKHKKINAINAALAPAVADLPYVTLMNINKVFLDKDGNLPASIMPDYLHPNAVGYEKWGAALDSTIKQAL